MRVMSFNIRFDNPADGPNGWAHRKDWVAEVIDKNADVAGLQEVVKNQFDDLKSRLPEFELYGVGRTDGKEAGEYVPLLWRKDRFTAGEKGVFWLSETPDKPSTGWDAALPRIATWARPTDKQSGKTFLMVNVHFDHKGEQARRESAKLIRRWIGEHANGGPVVLTGDFNSSANSVAYKNLTGKGQGIELVDSRLTVKTPEGPKSTWNGFKEIVPGRRIDFIFTAGPVAATGYRTLDETREGRFPSDHLPIVASVKVMAE